MVIECCLDPLLSVLDPTDPREGAPIDVVAEEDSFHDAALTFCENGIPNLFRMDETKPFVLEIPGSCPYLGDCAWSPVAGVDKYIEDDCSDLPSRFDLLRQLLCGALPEGNANNRQLEGAVIWYPEQLP